MKLVTNIIIGFLVASAIFFGAKYMLDRGGEEEVAGLQTVVSTSTQSVDSRLTTNSIQTDDFLELLNAAQSINFNSPLFTDDAFLGLENFQQPLPTRPVGRVNPFAPFDSRPVIDSTTRVTNP